MIRLGSLARLGALLTLSAAAAGAVAASHRPAHAGAQRSAHAASAPEASVVVERFNAAVERPVLAPGRQGDAVVRAQILLDRAWFSPGEIDGRFSTNMRRVVAAFQGEHGLPPSGKVDAATWEALQGGDSAAPLAVYRVAASDVAGPFAPIPADMMERAKLKSLGWESPEEALGERFHMSPKLLLSLNRGRKLQAGEDIVVAAVTVGGKPAPIPSPTPKASDSAAPGTAMAPSSAAAAGSGPRGTAGTRAAHAIRIDKGEHVLYVVDAKEVVVAAFPISIGGPLDPLPVGRMKISSEVSNPQFTYDPVLLKNARPGTTKTDIAPGPNNPVGDMWLGLTKPHWGIHGTPSPERVGHEETNGCIHLTNWDAHRVASLVKVGTVVDVRD